MILRKFRQVVDKVLLCWSLRPDREPLSSPATSVIETTAAKSNTAPAENDDTMPTMPMNQSITAAQEETTLLENDDSPINDSAVNSFDDPDPSTSSLPLPCPDTVPSSQTVVNSIARVILAGVYLPSSSPLRLLRSCPDIVERIFMEVKDAWRAQLYFGHESWSDDAVVTPTGSLIHSPWKQSPRPPAEMLSELAVDIVSRDVHFPPPKDLNCNMLPFRPDDLSTVPPEFRGYIPLIQQCDSESQDAVWYLTIQESVVNEDGYHRRPGIHVEGFLATPALCLRPPWWWGWGRGSRFSGGVFHASTVSDSCKMWNVQIPRELSDVLQIGCDLEHLRGTLTEYTQPLTPKENQLWWMTDATPHESLRLKPGTYRQYFRVVVGPISAWWSKHSTANLLGVQPDCQIFDHSKFEKGAYMDFDHADRSTCERCDRAQVTASAKSNGSPLSST